LNEARAYHGSCVLNRVVYVFCGMDNGTYLNSVERWDGGMFWDLIDTNIPVRTSCGAIAVNYDEIIVFGGRDSKKRLRDVWLLNTETKVTKVISKE